MWKNILIMMSLIFLLVGCQPSQPIKMTIQQTDDYIEFDIEPLQEYRQLEVIVHCLKDGKWNIESCSRLKEEKLGEQTKIVLDNRQKERMMIHMKTKSVTKAYSMTEQLLDFSVNDSFENIYLLPQETQIQNEQGFPLMAYYRDFHHDYEYVLNFDDLYHADDIHIGEKDEYYIITASLTN